MITTRSKITPDDQFRLNATITGIAVGIRPDYAMTVEWSDGSLSRESARQWARNGDEWVLVR